MSIIVGAGGALKGMILKDGKSRAAQTKGAFMSLIKSTGLVGLMTFLSRILGLIRDLVFARFLGAGLGMDVFVVAFQIPNFLRRLFGEGAFAQAFVPVFSAYHAERAPADVQELANRVAGTLGLILLGLTVVGVVGAPLLIWVFSSGFSAQPGKFDLAVDMLRITFPYIFFISLTGFAGGMMNTFGRFGVPAFTPVLLNVCLILAAVYFSTYFEQPVIALGWGVFVAGIAQLLFQLPFLARLGLLPKPRWGWKHSGVQRILKLMLPAIFGATAAQLNLIIDRIIASWLVTGSIAWLYYSDRLMEFPLGVFAVALATIILPGLSKRFAKGDTAGFSHTLDYALRLVLIVVLPAAVALFVLAKPILTTLFQYGAFAGRDVQMAAYSLQAYAVGLLGFSLVKVLAPGYFARQDTKTPVRVGVIAMLINIVLNLAIVVPMVQADFVAPHMGLALATGIAAMINAGLLLRGLLHKQVYRPGSGWGSLSLRVVLANVILVVALVFLMGDPGTWLQGDWKQRVWWMTQCVLGGGLVYALALLLFGLRFSHLRVNSDDGSV